MAVKIDRKLNLVIPVDRDEGPIYVHSTPISREVFERHFLVMGKAFAAIWDEGLHITVGPRVASLMLRRISERLGIWDGEEGVEAGLMAEIRRLSNVALLSEKGWSSVPFQDAADKGTLSAEEVAEVEGELVFFTLESCLRKRSQLGAFLASMTRLWGSQTTSLDCTAYAASLPISTRDENIGETATLSFIPV